MGNIFIEYTSDPAEIASHISAAVKAEDHKLLDEIVGWAATYCFKRGPVEEDVFPNPIFDMIMQLMTDESFLKMVNSHNLLMLFEYDWARLREDQKDRLLQAFSTAYDQFSDWMSYFVISEILGEYYCNGAAYQLLVKLMKTTNETARALIPHGFEHIVKDAQDSSLRKRAMSGLLSMKNDRSVRVKDEVEESLSHLLARGISPQSLG